MPHDSAYNNYIAWTYPSSQASEPIIEAGLREEPNEIRQQSTQEACEGLEGTMVS